MQENQVTQCPCKREKTSKTSGNRKNKIKFHNTCGDR